MSRVWVVAFMTVVCLAACEAEPPDEFHFQPTAVGGKADAPTSALLPADELAQLDAKLTSAIAAADAQIAALMWEISIAQEDLARKEDEIDRLIGNIEQRQGIVAQNYNNTYRLGLIAALFGYPVVVAASLVQAYEQDGLLRSLNAKLAAARTERDKIRVRIKSYESQRFDITWRLEPVRKSYVELKALLVASTVPHVAAPAEIEGADWVAAERARFRVATLGKVLANARTQIGLLKQLLVFVQAANAQVNAAVVTVTALAKAADEEAARSTELFHSLLKIALSGDPEAAAEDWLHDELARRTQQALGALDWPAKTFVEALLADAPDAALAQELLVKLTTALPPPSTPSTPTSVTLTTSKTTYAVGEPIIVSWQGGPGGTADWIGIYRRGAATTFEEMLVGTYTSPLYVATAATGHLQADDPAAPLAVGRYTAYYFVDDGYTSVASVDFAVK